METAYLEQFFAEDVQPLLDKNLEALEEDFIKNRLVWKEKMIQDYHKCWKKCCELQQEKTFSAGVLMFHVLRTRLLARDYRYKILLYDEEWYVGPYLEIGDMDVSCIFQYYDMLWDSLLKVYPKYFQRISELQVEQMMLRLIDYYHAYVVALLNYSLLDGLECKEFTLLNKADLFQIQAGEIMEPCDVIYIWEKEKKEYKKIAWLEKKLSQDYETGDFTKLNLEGLECKNLNLRFANFSGSNLEHASFWTDRFDGARFRKTNLQGAVLAFCMLSCADFQEANLENAYLEGCMCYTGKKDWNSWSDTGFWETDFRKANLSGANFSRAVLHGADFRGATLDKTDFTGATLYGSIFSKEEIANCNFSSEQLEQIVVSGL